MTLMTIDRWRLSAPLVVEAFQKGGTVSLAGSPEHFGDFIRSEIAKYADVIHKAGITAEG